MEASKKSAGSSFTETFLHSIPTPLRQVFDGVQQGAAGKRTSKASEVKVAFAQFNERVGGLGVPLIFVAVLLTCAPIGYMFSYILSGPAVLASSPIEPALVVTSSKPVSVLASSDKMSPMLASTMTTTEDASAAHENKSQVRETRLPEESSKAKKESRSGKATTFGDPAKAVSNEVSLQDVFDVALTKAGKVIENQPTAFDLLGPMLEATAAEQFANTSSPHTPIDPQETNGSAKFAMGSQGNLFAGVRESIAHSAPAKPEVAEMGDSNASIPRKNGTERILKIWRQGQFNLRRSNCQEADRLLSSASRLLDEATGDATLEQTLPAKFRNKLESDRAITMICTSRFALATEILGQQALETSSVHLNALGYARYMLKDYQRAGSAFEAALQADPLNSIIWSNLAAARLQMGNIVAADDAMFHALDPEIVRFHSDPRLHNIFFSNVNVIAQHAAGQTEQRPHVELWYAPN